MFAKAIVRRLNVHARINRVIRTVMQSLRGRKNLEVSFNLFDRFAYNNEITNNGISRGSRVNVPAQMLPYIVLTLVEFVTFSHCELILYAES